MIYIVHYYERGFGWKVAYNAFKSQSFAERFAEGQREKDKNFMNWKIQELEIFEAK